MDNAVAPPDSPREIRLAELLAIGVPVAWPEAVAIITVLAVSALRQLPPISLPTLEHVLIDTDGHVIAEASQPVGNNGVPTLRRMLAALLQTSQPPVELVSLTEDSGRGGRIDDLDKFTYELTFFCRPDDTVEIAALANRAVVYFETHETDDALESLTRKARELTAAPPAPLTSRNGPVSWTRTHWAALGAAIVLLGGTTLAWQLLGAPSASDTTSPTGVAELARRVQSQVNNGVVTLQQEFGLAAVDTAPKGRDRQLPRPSSRPASPRADAGRAPLPAELAYGLLDGQPDGLESADAGRLPGVEVPEFRPQPDLNLYSAQDAGVVAPTLVRPQMPAVRIEGLTQEAAGDLELLVGPDGRVEQARLVPASNRYQDRMMVSAAKTWTFAPATKNGQPVRYRVRIPITW